MKTQLVGLNPDGIVGMALYYLKSYYMGKVDPVNSRDILISGYDVYRECELATNEICNYAPDLLAFSCYVWNMEEVLAICSNERKHLPGTTILLGGPEASARAVELLKKNSSIDIVGVGEGEITFSEVVDHYCTGRIGLADIRGIVYRENGEIRTNPQRPVIKDLDEIPSPFLNGVVEFDKLKGYLYGYETFRGCPYSCTFCYWGRMMNVRYFSQERVNQEMSVILNSSMRRMWLGDAVANLNKKRFKDFLRHVIEANSGLVIDFEMVADLLDEETIELMGQLHDGYVAFGLQSINDRALATVERNWNREKFTRNVQMLRQRTDKIKIYIDLIYGLPHDTPQTYEDGIRYAMSLLPNKIQLHPLLLLPGSPLFDKPQDFGMVYEEKAPHYVLESRFWSRENMAESAKWTNKIFVYFNPAVNSTVIMLSQLLNVDPFDLFNRLYEFIVERIDPTFIFSDIGIQRENALMLNDMLEEFIRAELVDESFDPYLSPLIDAMAFAGCKTMFYTSGPHGGGALPFGWDSSRNGVIPVLSRDVVLKRFSHNMRALYKGNLSGSPDALLQFEPRIYDVLFNLRTHSIYHVSEHVSDLLAASSGDRTLEEMVAHLVQTKNLAVDNGAYSAIQETFKDLAQKQVVDLKFAYQVAV